MWNASHPRHPVTTLPNRFGGVDVWEISAASDLQGRVDFYFCLHAGA